MNSERERRERARSIIRNYSIATGTASGALAIGAIFRLDIALSIPIVIKMIIDIGNLFGLRINVVEEVTSSPQFKSLASRFLALSFAKSVISVIPVIGNITNGVVTYQLIQSIGWAVYEIFNDGRDLEDLDDEEIRKYLRRSKSLHKNDG